MLKMDSQKVDIVRITVSNRLEREETVVREKSLKIFLNDREMTTLLCSPAELNVLAVGWLYSEGWLRSRDDIDKVLVDDVKGEVRVTSREGTTHTGGTGIDGTVFPSPVESETTITVRQVLALVYKFQHHSQTFLATGGVHSAGLCIPGRILVFAEDIGRHNALDKIFGRCLLEGKQTADRIVVTSGRVPSEILRKVARYQIPVVISVSAPTDAGVKLARELGITLIGFVRGQRMNVYTHDWRVR
jgi:FdhD protein